ncbi:MAG: holin [Candidatus Paceibacterota bacterium]|jgi:hypothetical protein
MQGEAMLGQYGITVILTVILSLFYRGSSLDNRWKPLIAILIGMALGVVAMIYQGTPFAARPLIDALLGGFMSGASMVGLYEGFRAVARPRE